MTCCASSASLDTIHVDQTVLSLEFLFLDETVCQPCGSTGRSVDEAVAIVTEPLAAIGKALDVRRVHVANRQEAVAHHLLTSPTIRINGIDIDPERTQSECGSCGDIAGGRTTIDCRTWQWRGQSYNSAPTGKIVEAILSEATKAEWSPLCCVEANSDKRYALPLNLEQFFQAREDGESSCC